MHLSRVIGLLALTVGCGVPQFGGGGTDLQAQRTESYAAVSAILDEVYRDPVLGVHGLPQLGDEAVVVGAGILNGEGGASYQLHVEAAPGAGLTSMCIGATEQAAAAACGDHDVQEEPLDGRDPEAIKQRGEVWQWTQGRSGLEESGLEEVALGGDSAALRAAVTRGQQPPRFQYVMPLEPR